MVQSAEGARLLLETRAARGIAGHVARRDFHRYRAIQAADARAPHLSHAALAQLVEDFVVPQDLTGHLLRLKRTGSQTR